VICLWFILYGHCTLQTCSYIATFYSVMHLSLLTVESTIPATVHLFLDVNPDGTLESNFLLLYVVVSVVA
jgi:hypothetical protein